MITLPVDVLCLGAVLVAFVGGAIGWKMKRQQPCGFIHSRPLINDGRAEQLRKNISWWEREIADGRATEDPTALLSMLSDMRTALKP